MSDWRLELNGHMIEDLVGSTFYKVTFPEFWKVAYREKNAFRSRKATSLNQAAGARSTEGLHGIAQRAYGIHSEGMAWNHRQGRCMSLPRSGGWNPRNARHGITPKVCMASPPTAVY